MSKYKLENLLREAEGFYELELYDKSLERLAEYDEAGGDFLTSLRIKGEVLRAAERYRQAVPVLERVNRLLPKDLDVYIGLGWCYKRTDRLGKAVHTLESALKVDPSFYLAKYNLACYYALAGDEERCFEYLAEAVRHNADYARMAKEEQDFAPVRESDTFEEITSGRRQSVS